MEKNEQNDFLLSLGKKLQEIRKSRSLSQEKVSLYAEINKNYLCDLEKGRRKPTIKVLYKLAKFYGVDLKDLF